jgi:hypothetical protein
MVGFALIAMRSPSTLFAGAALFEHLVQHLGGEQAVGVLAAWQFCRLDCTSLRRQKASQIDSDINVS